MKKVLITGLATVAIALGAFAQGAVDISNASSAGGPTQAGNYYGGPYGLEVWWMNGTAAPAIAGGTAAYLSLEKAGFQLATTISGKSIPAGQEGIISGLGAVEIAGVDRNANQGKAILALAMWTGSAASFANAANASGTGGVLTFANDTSNFTTSPKPTAPSLTGWDQNLLLIPLVPIPEPATFALAGLGAAALLIFRRRK